MSLERRAAMATLLAGRSHDLLVVPGLGSTAWDLAAAGDNDRNFYLWGAMGGAAMIGLGLALAQPERRVAVITGDGEMLMGLGSLATIVRDASGLTDLALRLKGLRPTLFARVLIEAAEPPRVLPLRDGVALKQRFRTAIGLKA